MKNIFSFAAFFFCFHLAAGDRAFKDELEKMRRERQEKLAEIMRVLELVDTEKKTSNCTQKNKMRK